MSDIDAVNAVSAAEEKALFSLDTDALVALFTEDCVLMAPNQPEARGQEGVRTWMNGLVAHFEFSGEYTDTDVSIAGDTAVQRYHARITMTPKEGGDPVTVPLKGLHIMKRQGDGGWKIWQDIWNADTE